MHYPKPLVSIQLRNKDMDTVKIVNGTITNQNSKGCARSHLPPL